MNSVIKLKAKSWYEAVLFIQSHIKPYPEGAEAFQDLLNLALESRINSRMVEEKTTLLAGLANELSSKDSELSCMLNQFAGICTFFYCSPEKLNAFQEIIKANKWVNDVEARKRAEEDFRREQERIRRAEEEKREQTRRQEETKRRQEEESRRKREEEYQRQEVQKRTQERIWREAEVVRQRQRAKKQAQKRIWKRMFVFLFVLSIVGTWGYNYWYVPMIVKRDAPRTYVYANNLFVRSSKNADVEGNKVVKVPYGAELITYSQDADGWSKVEFGDKEGYVASSFVLNKEDFTLLDNVWADEMTRNAVATAKCRLAILDFLKKENLSTGANGWQLSCKDAEVKPNTIIYPRLANGYDDFSDFGFVLNSAKSVARLFALYSFQKNEEPILVYSEETTEAGNVKNVGYNSWRKMYKVYYTKAVGVNSAKINETIVSVPSNIENQQKNEALITITNVSFANCFYDNSIIDAYGTQIYTDTRYLKPKITFDLNAVSDPSVAIGIKIFTPSGRLMTGADSPSGFTIYSKITTSGEISKNVVVALISWGSKTGGAYSEEGDYKVEFWLGEQCLKAVRLNIKVRSVIEKSSSSENALSATTKMPITFYRSAFANVNKNKILDDYGARIRAKDVKAIKPRLDYTNSSSTNKSLEIAIKIISPDGQILGSKYIDYTYYELVTFSSGSGSSFLESWTDTSTKKFVPGNYVFEVWYCGTRLYQTNFTLY